MVRVYLKIIVACMDVAIVLHLWFGSHNDQGESSVATIDISGCSKYLISNYSTIPGWPWNFSRQSSINQLEFRSNIVVSIWPRLLSNISIDRCASDEAQPFLSSPVAFWHSAYNYQLRVRSYSAAASGCHTKSTTQKQTLYIHILRSILEELQRICH